MRCSIDCIEFLKDYYDFKNEQLKEDLQNEINQNGISIYDLIVLSNKNGLFAQAIHTFLVPKQLPCIVYQKQKKVGHYYILVKRNKYSFSIYDPIVGIRRINKIWFYLFFSHLCVICYNNKKKEVTNEN